MQSANLELHVRLNNLNSGLSKSDVFYKRLIPTITTAVAIVAIGAIGYLYLKKTCLPNDNFPIDGSAQSSSSTKQSCDWIATLKEFPLEAKSLENQKSSVSIKSVEAIVKQSKLFGGRTFIEKMQQDCTAVQRLGTTFHELANHLQKLYDLAKNNQEFSYDPSIQNDAVIGKCSKTQNYESDKTINYSDQTSYISYIWPIQEWEYNIFDQEIRTGRGFGFTNLDNKANIYITPEDIHLIRNGYFDRTNPIQIAALLTPHSLDEIQSAIGHSYDKEENGSLLMTKVKTVTEAPLLSPEEPQALSNNNGRQQPHFKNSTLGIKQ